MADIKDQLIKDSYNYVLQSDLSTGVVYRIGGSIPVNPIFSSGLTINGDFNYSNGTEQPGYVLTTNGSGYSYWNAVSGSSGISGSGTSNYLPKWSGSTSLVNSLVYDATTGVTIGTGFTWDNTNSRLGIGTTTPTYKFEVRDTGSSSVTHFLKFRNDNNDYGGITIGSGSGQDLTIQQNTGYGYLATSGFRIGSSNGVIWTNNGSIFRIVDPATEATNYLRIASTTGNVLINTGTDSGFKLDVNGTARIQGNTNIINSSGPSLLTLGGFNNLPELRFINTNTKITVDANSAINFVSSWGVVTNHYLFYPASNLSNTSTTGVANGVALNIGFAPTSGTASFNQLSLVQTINQTGGASGITRGVYVNPTLTSASDFRAIETTVGNVILNSVSGNTLIGTTADTGTYKLDVSNPSGYSAIGIQTAINTNAELQFKNHSYSLPRWTIRASGAANGASGNLVFQRLANTFPMTITSSDNILIGTTTDAGYKLDVNGTARISGATTLQGVVAVNSTNVSTGYALFVNGVIGATSLTLTQNLTMGENYAISNNGSQTIDIDANNDTTNAIFRVTANGTADELFRVNESGNFGIGTISPTQKLQVSGNTLLQGSLTATTKTTIGSEGDISCALLQMASTTQGVLFPRMTNTQRTSISTPVAGLMVYCTDSPEGLFIYKSTGWVQII